MTQVAQSIHQNGFKSKISFKALKNLSSSSLLFTQLKNGPNHWIVKDGFSSPQDLKAGSIPFYSPSKFIFSYVWTCLLFCLIFCLLYIFEKFKKCSNSFKINQNVPFELFNFGIFTNFVLIKFTCLLTLFDCRL